MTKDEFFDEMSEVIKIQAYKIKLSHGGWWESYVSDNERKIVELSDKLIKEGWLE